MEIGTLIQIVDMIDNQLNVKRNLLLEQLDNKMPIEIVTCTSGAIIALTELRDYLQGGIEADINAMEIAYGCE